MKKQIQSDEIKRLTVVFGYSLFALLLLALVLFTIIPFGSALFNPVVRHSNVAILLIALVAGAVLPALISYFLGDRATHVKGLTEHHFNGVLFGISAYWLSNLFTLIGIPSNGSVRTSFPESLATVINGWPILATVLVMSAVAIGYAHQRKHQASLLESRLYQLVLFGGIVAVFAYTLVYRSGPDSASNVMPLLEGVVIPIVFFGVSYAALLRRRITPSIRLSLAAVALSIGYIAASTGGQLFPGAASYLDPFLPLAIGFLVLVMYLLLVRRAK